MKAAEGGHLAVVTYLVQAGAKTDTENNVSKRSVPVE
jgi:hypothetical protein